MPSVPRGMQEYKAMFCKSSRYPLDGRSLNKTYDGAHLICIAIILMTSPKSLRFV